MSIKIVELASYTAPKISENKRDEWVSYGDDNNYYQYLIDLYNASPTNNAAINGISQMIFGRGLDATDSNTKLEEYAMMKSLFTNDCVRKLSYDLKLMGQCAMQVVYDKAHKKIIEVAHFPIETLRVGKANEEGEIDAYYYFNDWNKIKPSDKPKRFSAFGFSKDEIEILCVKPYRAGFYYYSPVDYQGGLQYAELEEEISNYHINNIKNGLAPSMLINFNNGVPDEEQREIIENKIKQKFSGTSNAGKFILSFNDNAETQASLETVQLSDAHNQYQFLSDESMRKIMVAHRIISPMLLGIKDNTGLGNNADELKTASILFDNTVIRPFQELLLTAFNKVLSFNNASLNLYFKTLQPLEFVDLENALTKEQVEEETGQKLSSDLKDLTDAEFEALENDLEGEVIDDEWELVDKREYSEENESIEDWANRLIKEKKTGLQKLADFIKSKPSDPSFLDKSYYKVRFEYAQVNSPNYKGGASRTFCRNMMSRTDRGVVYRKEDIDQASFQGVNNSFGHKGQNYSLFKYKGGVNCRHYWNENLYRLKTKTDGTYYEDKSLASSEEVDDIPKSYIPKGEEYETSKVAPTDMPNSGHHPNYKG
jgi:hypothetical protein